MEQTPGTRPTFLHRQAGRIRHLTSSFRPTERIFFSVFAILLAGSSLYLLSYVNDKYSVELPVHGGSYTEGIVGYARFINPVLEYTDADKDMTALVYSGLLKATPDGKMIGDLAQSWSVSSDGLTYSFMLKPNLTFQDGQPLTADDIVFTIQKVLDPTIKSPKADSWAGIQVVKVSSREIHFILQKPYSPFLEDLTIGILPQHIWKNVDDNNFDVSTYNREPVGSGPFKVKSERVDSDGVYESYDLVPFPGYASGVPYIGDFVARFYAGEDDAITAYKNGTIDALGGISPDSADELVREGHVVKKYPLPRIFGLFFNQSQAPVLLNKEVRQALDASVDRDLIVQQVLGGWGESALGPVPNGFSLDSEISGASSTEADSPAPDSSAAGTTGTQAQLISAGRQILEAKGWKVGPDGVYSKQQTSGKKTETQRLAFTISTSDSTELKQTAEILKDTWQKLGADVSIEIYEPSDLASKVIRPRKYDALLFGNVIGRDLDLYPFWHSSERNDPGLNVSLYTNAKADQALETIRTTSDDAARLAAFGVLQSEIRSDLPALFLYSPDYIYATRDYVHDLNIGSITSPSERFLSVDQWYTETDKVWKMFAGSQSSKQE